MNCYCILCSKIWYTYTAAPVVRGIGVASSTSEHAPSIEAAVLTLLLFRSRVKVKPD
jgi:uncharacterized membrane protein